MGDELFEKIPEKFWRYEESPPEVRTVGELIAILNELPSDLKIRQGFSGGVSVVVMENGNYGDLQVEFDDAENIEF